MKKCSDCSQLHERSSKRCRMCVDKENSRQRKQYQERLTNNLCPRCGEQPVEGSKHCFKCAPRVKEKGREIRSLRLEKGLCCQCGQNVPVDGLKTCQSCLCRLNAVHRSRAKRLKGLGLCIRCGRFTILSGKTSRGTLHDTCQSCYLKHISSVNLGSVKYADDLLRKMEDQNYQCPYTGDQLTIGDRTWIDHILPRSRFPELAHDIDNVEWVTETVNRMKQDQTPGEFLSLIKQIHEHKSL